MTPELSCGNDLYNLTEDDIYPELAREEVKEKYSSYVDTWECQEVNSTHINFPCLQYLEITVGKFSTCFLTLICLIQLKHVKVNMQLEDIEPPCFKNYYYKSLVQIDDQKAFDKKRIQQLIKHMMAFPDGPLENLTVEFLSTFALVDLLMHNTFRKTNIKNYLVKIDTLICFSKHLDLSCTIDPGFWYITPYTFVSRTEKVQYNKTTHILTFNGTDFKRYPDIEVLDPAAVVTP